MTYTIRRLNFGGVNADESVRVRGIAPGNPVTRPAQGYLILGGSGGPILVDAGYRDPSVLGAGGTVEPGQGFEEQLARHGVAPADLQCVVLTHAHRDHAGHIHKVPMHVPVVLDRSELGFAVSGLQGKAYAQADVQHLIDRLYTPGALRFLDLAYSGPAEIAPDVVCHLSGGHTPGSIAIEVPLEEGSAYLCGDLIGDVRRALRDHPSGTFAADLQPYSTVRDDPGITNQFVVSVQQEVGAIKRAQKYRYLLPAHDDPALLDHGRYVGRIDGDTVPGPITED